ncbi:MULTISPECIES: TetR/AcrR family transcriptional regulator [unclassified Sporosarcina]|uniref:TetR/AcrR family transcriptional regulator n=1 Tax=unclassified Sporosarcina TaxID=2647733 RepID=UPI000C16F255|nr:MULTISPECIES: TetR/AcrR family transcriptional regulator [unclassified Sporosarcina]PID05833.1 TetR family transcriptional regulator [Sporosarcina sp. P30]PID09027.1 TetR family transcriptional regulator [Sporosarcina sp. P31]PID12324.1 TetR family transcriptional regulator [Sporosarcina sp. P32b]
MDRREEIMLAAEKSFSMFGYKATTMDQVAKIANVGKGTIYTFFSNKEELFHSIVWKMVGEMKDVSEQTAIEGASFQENAHARIMQLLKFRETHQLFIKLIEEEKELRTPAVGDALTSIEKEILKFIAGKIERGVAKGELKPCNSELIAFLLFRSYVALVNDWSKTHDEQLTEKQITDVLNGTIFSSLLV